MASRVTDYCCYISELPITLLHEIFFKLPIKCVSLCKCVSPEWNSLLSNPSFSDDYAAKSTVTAILCRIGSNPTCFVPDTFNLIEICDNGDAIESHIVPDQSQSLHLFLVGSSNGLLCMKSYVHLYDSVFITNPLLGDTIEVPKNRALRGTNRVDFQFGYCLKTNKFKVLKFAFKSPIDCSFSGCEILTVGVDDRWRPLHHSSFEGLHLEYNFVALDDDDDGFFFWVPRFMGPGYRPDFIQTFDLAEEKFGKITLPPSFSQGLVPVESAAFGNQLCFVEFSVPSQISIWKLTKKSVTESSWTKVAISTSWLPFEIETFCFFPVASLKNGEMLFKYMDESLVSCNVEQKRCSIIKINGDGRYSVPVPGYTPSFSTKVAQVIEREQGLLVRADVKMNKIATE